MKKVMNEHLQPYISDRGFSNLPAIAGEYGGQINVCESIHADSPHLWISIDDATIHLTLENAAKLADQLQWYLTNHYQVKS